MLCASAVNVCLVHATSSHLCCYLGHHTPVQTALLHDLTTVTGLPGNIFSVAFTPLVFSNSLHKEDSPKVHNNSNTTAPIPPLLYQMSYILVTPPKPCKIMCHTRRVLIWSSLYRCDRGSWKKKALSSWHFFPNHLTYLTFLFPCSSLTLISTRSRLQLWINHI